MEAKGLLLVLTGTAGTSVAELTGEFDCSPAEHSKET